MTTMMAKTTTTDAINSVWNCATRIKERHFNMQFIGLQFQKISSRRWNQHLTELPSNDDEKKNLNSFLGDLIINLPTRDRIKNITEDKNDVVACMDGENKVQLIHRISNLEGTRSLSKDKFLGINGIEQQVIFVELIPDSVAIHCNFPAPSLEDYKQCQSKKVLEELEVDYGVTSKGSSCFIPSPFLRCVLINAGTNNKLELIPMVIHAGE